MIPIYMIQRVLLVDDEEVDNFIHEKIIKNAAYSNDIVVTTSAKSALSFLENHLNQFPELILLDVKMPAMNGYEFLQNFSKFPTAITNSCSVIALSSLVDEVEIARIKELPNINGFFSKPLTESKLGEIQQIVKSKIDLSKDSGIKQT